MKENGLESEKGEGNGNQGEIWRGTAEKEGDGRSTYSARCRLSVHAKEMDNIEMGEDSLQLPQWNPRIFPTIDQLVSHQFTGYHHNDIMEFCPL